MFRRLFKGGSGPAAADAETIEDLIVLERYDEAEARLKAHLKYEPDDLHSHLKLAEVYGCVSRFGEAAALYIHVAEEFAADGFLDKGIALLSRAQKMLPADTELPRKIYAFEQAKKLEHKRTAAVEGMRLGEANLSTSSRVVDLQRLWFRLAADGLITVLPTDQVRRLFSVLRFDKPDAGETLVSAGGERPELLLLVGAEVEVRVEKGGVERSLRTFGPRDILGEMALFEQTPWPATIRVTQGGLILALDRPGLEKALLGNPDPRSLVSALRAQGNDREIVEFVRRLGS